MTNKVQSREISDLGIEASRQYAKAQEALDQRFLEESRLFPTQLAATSAISSYLPIEFEESFSLSQVVWAKFSPPADYYSRLSGLFSFQMIPSVGGSDALQAIGDKLEALEKSIPSDKTQQYEFKTISSFVQLLTSLTRTSETIYARCNQYKLG
jgi:hypothetical protein